MLIKSADDKTKDIFSLESILTRSDLTNVTKKRIEQEIKTFMRV